MRHVVLDIETNGLLDETTKLHCLVLRDLDTDAVLSCTDDSPDYAPISKGLEVLAKAERTYAHNGIRFDRPALHKLTGYLIPWERVFDTRVVSEMRFTNLKETDHDLVRQGRLPSPLIGKSRLEAWGYRLGLHKGDYGKVAGEPPRKRGAPESEASKAKWLTWSPEMQDYCCQDTAVTAELVRHLRKAGVSQQAVETEQELAAYLDAQERNGWPFDIEKAAALQATLAARREHLEVELRAIYGWWWKPKGEFTPKRDNAKMGYVAGCPSTKLERVDFNPGSRQHIADRLTKLHGWKPTVFTDGGQPRVDEDTLTALPQDTPGVKAIVEYLLVGKRLGQLAEGDNAWLKCATNKKPAGGAMTGMQHIHGGVLQSGTITHRAAHIFPNIGQVPKVGNPFGQECRELFTVPPGWVQVGADASGLELRELSHYMARFDGGAYGKVVLEGRNEDGTDIHSTNRNALGLEGKKGRDEAKTFIYAFLYGAGDLKLGRSMPPTPADVEAYRGNTRRWAQAKQSLAKRDEPTDDFTVACLIKGGQLRARFLKNLPALGNLITEVKERAKVQGFLTLHDGRRVPVRHAHAALNTLLQGSGAVVCKRWIVRFNRRLVAEFGPQGWGGQWAALGWIHDEVQLAVRTAIAERVKEILVEEIRATGTEFSLRIALDGEAKTGRNWADCH